MLVAAAYVMIAGVLLWCAAAAGAGVLTFRRTGWARVVLVVCAAACGAVCLLGTVVGAFVLVFPLMGALLTVGLLLRGDTGPWFHPRG
jgi:hypothetical protein